MKIETAFRLINEAFLKHLIKGNHKPTTARGQSQPIEVSLSAYNKKSRKASFEVDGMTDGYMIYVDILEPTVAGKKLVDHRIKISCSCPDFKYRANWTLANMAKSAERRYDNGKRPDKTDPKRQHKLCKHCVKAAEPLGRYIFTDNMNLKKV